MSSTKLTDTMSVSHRLLGSTLAGLAMVALVLGVLYSPQQVQAAPEAAPLQQAPAFTLTLLHTNDVHAHIDQYLLNGANCPTITNTSCIAGAPRLMTKIKQLSDSNTLLLDAGDQFQGSLFYNLFKADIVTSTMNAMGYQAMAIGNHEFDDKSPELDRLINGAKFPILSANIYNPNIAAGKVKPSVVITVNGQAIGVIGLTTPDTTFTSSPEGNVVFSNTVTSLQAEVDRLTSTLGLNKVVALVHLGYPEERALARAVRGVDVIIGGHSHTFLYTLVGTYTTHPESGDRPEGPYPTKETDLDGNQVLIVTAASWGRYLGHLNVGFDAAGKVVSSAGEPIFMNSKIAKDPTLEAIVASYRPKVDELNASVIGTTTVDLPHEVNTVQVCRLGECALGNLVADAMLTEINKLNPNNQYHIGFQNGGGLRQSLLKGNISRGGVLSVLPFGNTIEGIELTGTHVISALENGVSAVGTGSTGRFPQVSGIRFTWDFNKPVGSRIVLTSVLVFSNGNYVPLDLNARYKIVTNNFMRTGGDGYTVFRDAGLNLKQFGTLLDEALANYISSQPNKTVSPAIEGRITVKLNNTTIPALQGLTNTSPLSGQMAVVEGTVVGDFQTAAQLGGFFMQAFPGDGNPATSDGVFVNSTLLDVVVGDLVQVTGIVEESSGLTRLNAVSAINKLSSGNGVTATEVTLPISSTTAMEAYEGMLVRMPQTLYVTEHFQLGRFGEVVLSVNSRQMIPTHVAMPGSAAQDVQNKNNLARIVLDDGSNTQNPAVIPYPAPGLSAANPLRGGDTVANLTGILSFGSSVYRVQPTITPTFAVVNPRPAAPVTVNGSLKVVGFNTLNYFVTLGSRGAVTTTELQRQRDKLVPAIIGTGADIVGLMEIENHITNAALIDLVGSLNAVAGAGTYDMVADPAAGLGTDQIKVAMIYKPAKVTPVGVAQTIITGVFGVNTRPPFAQTFKDKTTGEILTVVANHFKSKSCPTPALPTSDPNADKGDGQGCWNADRLQAANILADWLKTDPTGSKDPDVLIIGDLNAYALEDPIIALQNKGYVNLIKDKLGDSAYSYVFGGQWGYLDHALASKSLAGQVTDLVEWHINADEPPVLDYNIEFKSTAQLTSLYAPNAYRSSDHDPVVVGFDLKPRTVMSTTPKLVPIGAAYEADTLKLFALQAIQHNQDPEVSLLVLPIAYNDESLDPAGDGDPYTISDAFRQENYDLAVKRAQQIQNVCTSLVSPTQCIARVPDIQIWSDSLITENIEMFSSDVDGIYTLGGDQLMAMRAVANTPVEERMEMLYKSGAAVGGNSAGAAILSRYMIGGYASEAVWPWHGLQKGSLDLWYGELNTITRGLRFGTDKAIVDQHVFERGRLARLLQAAYRSPGQKVGVGVDWGTGAVIENNEIVTSTAGYYPTLILDEETYNSAAQASYAGPLQNLSIKNVAMHLLPQGMYGYNLNSRRPIVNGVMDSAAPSLTGRDFSMLKAPAGAGHLLLSGSLLANPEGVVGRRFASLALSSPKPVMIVLAGYTSPTLLLSDTVQAVTLVGAYGITNVVPPVALNESNVTTLATQLQQAGTILFIAREQDTLAAQISLIKQLKLDERWKAGTHLLMYNAAAALVGDMMTAAPSPTSKTLAYEASDSFLKDNMPIKPGLGLIPGAAFEPQALYDYRYGRLVSLVQANKNMVAFGIDQGNGLEITPQGAQAWGPTALLAVDARKAGVLEAGQNGAFAATWLLLDTYVNGEILYGQAAPIGMKEAVLFVAGVPMMINTSDKVLTVSLSVSGSPTTTLRLLYSQLLTPTPKVPLPAPGVGRFFDLKLYNAASNTMITNTGSMTFVIRYDPDKLAGADKNKLKVLYFDELLQKWVAVTVVSRDIVANTITVQLNHLTEFAVTSGSSLTYLPIMRK